ncbi:MAG: DUF3592 domain-containing protein [Oscillospiraceae bacterium]
MTSFAISAALIVFAAAMLILGSKLAARRRKYLLGLDDFMQKCKRYKAVVLDVNDVPIDKSGNTVRAVILQFRDEERKSTIVHRYTQSSGKRYCRGSEVELYYCDESDTACIKGDNPFYRNAKKLGVLAVICRTAAVLGFLAAAAVFML